MLKLLRVTLYFICICIAGVIAAIIIFNKPVPRGIVGPDAEAYTDSMMAVVNCAAWDQLRFVTWSYKGKHHYVWDKYYHLAEIHYADLRILLNLNTLDGIVWKNGVRLSIHEKRKYLAVAWKFWCNDSFWLNPVCKLRDPGVVRRIVRLGNNKSALLATYTKGGVTPGDSFLWYTDEQYLPVAWRLWVHLLPIRGLKATWEGWTPDGIRISTVHQVGPYRIELQNLKSGTHYSDLGLARDPFSDFLTE